jgi:hypothetical protein
LKTSKDDAVVVATVVGIWSSWKGPPDPGGLSKLCASRAAYPRRFARRCGLRPGEHPPLRVGRRRERGGRNLDTPRLVPGQRRTSCKIRSGGRRRIVRRIGRTRRSCDRRVLCGAEVPCAQLSNRTWGLDGGAGNCVAGELAHSTSRESTVWLCHTSGSQLGHQANLTYGHLGCWRQAAPLFDRTFPRNLSGWLATQQWPRECPVGDQAEADRLAQLQSIAATMLSANSSGRERNGLCRHTAENRK